MSESAISTYLKPGFPVESNDGKSYRNELEYIGPYDTLKSNAPANGASWGTYEGRVSNAVLTPVSGTNQGELTVSIEKVFGADDFSSSGEIQETVYEVDWVVVSRSMMEHPAFAIGQGGAFQLSEEDIAALEKWRNEQDVAQKKLYKYKESDTSETYSTLTDNAQKFAKGIQLGVEEFDDFAPVVRRTTAHVNGLPNTGDAGKKDNPPSAAGGPSGYEWRKSADRAVRAGRQNRWERVEEWVGAQKVLCDKTQIYW